MTPTSTQPATWKEREKKAPGDVPGGPVVRLRAPSARGQGSIPGQGTKIPHATTKTWCSHNK